jgi:hypothetical protein
MPAEATQEVRIPLNRFDGDVVNPPHVDGARDESDVQGGEDGGD